MSFLSKEGENEVKKIFEDLVKKHKLELEKEEVKSIIGELIPNLDELISKRVKEHIKTLAEIVIKNI